MMPLRALALVAVVALTGCASPTVTDSADLDQITPAAASAPTNETEEPSEAEASLHEEPVSRNGTLSTFVGACIFVPPYPCAGTPGGQGDETYRLPPDNYTHARLTLTWDATSPLSRTFAMRIYNVTTQPDGSEQWLPLCQTVRGPSPLVLESDLEGLHPGEGTVILVLPDSVRQGPVWAVGWIDQPFHLSGTMTVATKAIEETADDAA